MAYADGALERPIDLLVATTEHTGIAYQRIHRVGVDAPRKIANALARAEIQLAELRERSGVLRDRARDRVSACRSVAAREDHAGARRGQRPRRMEADPAVGARHDHELPRQVQAGHRLVRRGPGAEGPAPVLHGLCSRRVMRPNIPRTSHPGARATESRLCSKAILHTLGLLPTGA